MTTITTRGAKGSELTHGELDANFDRDVDIKTASYSVAVSDNRTTLECNHATVAFTVTLGDAATMAASDTGDFEVTIVNIGAAVVTVARAGTDTIDGGATSVALDQYSSVTLKVNSATDGYNSIARGMSGLTSTITELNIVDAGTTVSTPVVASGDAFVMDDLDVGMAQVDIDNVDTYLAQTTKTLTNKTLTTPTITLKQGTTPTAEGDIQWDATNNTFKVGDGSGTKTFSDDSKSVTESSFPAITAGTTYLYEWEQIDAANSSSSATYQRISTDRIVIKRAGTYTVDFSLATVSAGTATGRVYKNGVATGTEQTTTSLSYVVKTEALTLATGDYLDIYLHGDSTYTASFKDFKLQSAVKLLG